MNYKEPGDTYCEKPAKKFFLLLWSTEIHIFDVPFSPFEFIYLNLTASVPSAQLHHNYFELC